MKDKLKPCPCGRTPDNLYITDGDTCKWAWVSGDCCGEWSIEFRTKYHQLHTKECIELSIKGWNTAGRGELK